MTPMFASCNCPQMAGLMRGLSHWEDRPEFKFAPSLQAEAANQGWREFLAIRRQSIGPFGQQPKCIITVRASLV
ncbi:unnamed protein product [Linum tenue]|uniref:Uncharacterized protein n=1 Tax=Linum tenue TaxID=586396 RepID=A0AAV0HSB8_9ROSI|nr:unnamed protein product [Linum tenue]CAI0387829.1 unnamed protein product [Linum tenue]